MNEPLKGSAEQPVTPTDYLEPYRPQVHFSPPNSWMNDPNGLIYYKGLYHLFYQHIPGATRFPDDPNQRRLHWGHAVSSDLIHWQHDAIALYPDEIGQIWSGSAVADLANTSGLVPGGGLIAVFSYDNQSIGIAYSNDDGHTWMKYAHNPVVPIGGKNFRDPKVFWHDETGRWLMLIAAGDCIKIYASNNLIQWELASEFRSERIAPEDVWECPDMFPLEVEGQTRWVLLFSLTEQRDTRYFVGSFDGTTFTAEQEDLILDYGPDNYAGVTWNHTPDGSRVFIGWLGNWRYANALPIYPWRGAMTVPRVFGLKRSAGRLLLTQQPVPQFDRLREQPTVWESLHVSSRSAFRVQPAPDGAYEVLITVVADTASDFGLTIHTGASENVTIGFDRHMAKLYVERAQSGHECFDGYASRFEAPVGTAPEQKLRIIVDRSSVEVFANAGEAAITIQVFPRQQDHEFVLFAENGMVAVREMLYYPLRRIWSSSAPQG